MSEENENINNEEDPIEMEQGMEYKGDDANVSSKEVNKIGNKKSLIIIGSIISIIIILVIFVPNWQKEAKIKAEKIREQKEAEKLEQMEANRFRYSYDELQLLRSYGYTATEIEENELGEVSPDTLVNKAKEEINNRIQEELAPYLDSASDEFKELQSNTWISQEPFSINKSNADSWVRHYIRRNCDYEKIPCYGYQLFIKVYISKSGNYAFMQVEPELYLSLEDSGNINIEIEYIQTEERNVIVKMTHIPL